jgi:hypothetical protein
MPDDITSSTEFLAEAAATAARLLQRGRSVFDVRYDGLAFGSWTLTAGRPKQRVEVSWDGREGLFTCRTATFGDSQSRPAWRTLSEVRPEDRSPRFLLNLAEQIIIDESQLPAA